MSAERRLLEMGIVLPAPLKLPPGVRLPFVPVRLIGRRVVISGHGPLDSQGNICGPFGKVGADVTPEAAADSARLTFRPCWPTCGLPSAAWIASPPGSSS